ncbi:MAG: CbiQ family ECF transporter T component [Tabrizicola sp.]
MLTPISPVDSVLHRWPAAAKLAAIAGLGVLLGVIADPVVLAVIFAGVWLAFLPLGGAEAAHLPRRLWPLWPFVLVIGGWHLFRGTPEAGLAVVLRMVTMFAAATLLLLTTRFDALLAAFSAFLRPLERLGLPVKRIALALAMAVRFIPVLSQRAGELAQAWRARSPRKPRHRLMVPLALAALDEADHAAEALRARSASV